MTILCGYTGWSVVLVYEIATKTPENWRYTAEAFVSMSSFVNLCHARIQKICQRGSNFDNFFLVDEG